MWWLLFALCLCDADVAIAEIPAPANQEVEGGAAIAEITDGGLLL